MSIANYTIEVQTGDKKGAGMHARAYIIIYGENGSKTSKLTLNHIHKQNFKRGEKERFWFMAEPFLGKIESIEIWRANGFGASWFVDTVNVSCSYDGESYIFPVLRWIESCKSHRIKCYDTSLPQNDQNRNCRTEDLKEKKKKYELISGVYGAPAACKNMPPDEDFSDSYKFDLGAKFAIWKADSVWKKLTLDNTFKNLSDFDQIYTLTFGVPSGKLKWKSDFFFGCQKLSGMNNSLISLCTAIPDKFGVTNDMVAPLLEGQTLQQAIDAKRIFIIDLEIMKDIPVTNGLVMPAPIALFYLNNLKELKPIAIQLFQQKAADNPVFLPTDPTYTWIVAKMWFNLAEANHHQSLTHLGLTHLLMEGCSVVMQRNLSQSHPLFKLLAPHFMYLIAVNRIGRKVLLAPGGFFDKSLTVGVSGINSLLSKSIPQWRFDVQGTLPEDLKRRGVDDPNVLPNYCYRDDGLLIYNAIKKYVTDYANLYYGNPQTILDDCELQCFGEELTRCRTQNGCGIKGVGNNEKFETIEHIVTVFTSIIYSCSVSHAAANFPQYDEYGFPPNYPLVLKGNPPRNKNPLTEDDVVTALPSRDEIFDILILANVLSAKGTQSMGDFEVDYIYDPPAVQIVERFREDLRKVSETVKERNRTRYNKYPWLDPEIVPNAISI